MNVFEVREINAKETYPVRHSELRKGKPLDACQFDGDDLHTTLHLGGFLGDQLTAVATLLRRDHTAHNLTNAYQLRGMAVLAQHHRKGFGKILLTFAEKLLREKGRTFLWMNARQNAVDFYKKLGYDPIGKPFEIPHIGTHYVLFKKLVP